MSAINFARQAFNREKPHSSVTDWVNILTADGIQEEAYDGIPELVDVINIQATGPTEASRALRKKLKHGSPHNQYRALVLLKALVENSGHKFQTSFADGQLTDAIKHLAADPTTDKRVKKKLTLVLGSWRDQFKSDPSMSIVAGLYKQCRVDSKRLSQQDLAHLAGLNLENERKKNEKDGKEEAKRRAKQEKEEARRKEEEDRRRQQQSRSRTKRVPFDFAKDKPKVLASIVDASQASSNLVNAITLVNQETDSLQTNERVQECLLKAKEARKPVVRYIQLVENEELIGTLIETNERIIAAMELYDKMLTPQGQSATDESAIADNSARISTESEVVKLQEKQRAAVVRAASVRGKGKLDGAHIHPDLEDLSFGPLGASSNNLPAPIRPSTLSDDGADAGLYSSYAARGSLSDFSDYESSNEETRNVATTSPRSRREYVNVSDDPDANTSRKGKMALVGDTEDDPFADPFADEVAVGSSRR